MAVSSIYPLTAANTSGSTAPAATTPTASSAGAVSSTEFMQLMTTQLENQDPLNPVDDTAMLAQLAQFSSLQQMQTLNQTMTAASEFSGLQQSASLIGMNVTTTNSDGSAGPSGQVTSVSMQSGVPYLTISGESVAASTVTTITTPSSGS